MKNLIKLLPALFISALLLASCVALRIADMRKISIGMDKENVLAALNTKPDHLVGARKYPGGVVEVLAFNQGFGNGPGNNITYKWLYFYNNKLELISNPGNWETEADLIVADNDRAAPPVTTGTGTGQ